MKKKTPLLLLFIITPLFTGSAQCADPNNVLTFTHNGKSYEIIKEAKTWADAAACAVARGGYLAEIGTAYEQNAINIQLQLANLTMAVTVAPDGGGASYVWIGGNDMASEGAWVWNGNNDAVANQFWQGTASGQAIDGRYTNWGNEPDNWGPNGGQDGLGLALTNWPLGTKGKWNDVNLSNQLFFVVEHNGILSTKDQELTTATLVYPNPAEDLLYIQGNTFALSSITFINTIGQAIKVFSHSQIKNNSVNIAALLPGVYFMQMDFEGGESATKKIIKK